MVALSILQPARKPRFRAGPLSLRKEHVPQSLACAGCLFAVGLRLCKREAALECPGTFIEIAARRLEPSDVTQRFHFRFAVAQLLGESEGLAIPGVRLSVAYIGLFKRSGPHQRTHRLREIPALLRLERVDRGIIEKSDTASHAVEDLRHPRAQGGRVQA